MESILFSQKLKISKTMFPCFGDSVAGQSSHMPQSRASGSILATCSRVEGPVVRGTQRFSRLSLRLPREWDFQSRKTLRKFFKFFGLKCFGRCFWRHTGDLPQSRKTRVVHSKGNFKIFFSFPSNFCDYSLSLSTVSFPNTPCHPLRTPFLLHFISKSSRKRYGFSLSHSIFLVFELFPFDYMCWYSDLRWVGDSVLYFVLVWRVEDLGFNELV